MNDVMSEEGDVIRKFHGVVTMQQIWKFPVQPGENFIEMPVEAKIISGQVDLKTGEPTIWAIVNPGALTEKRKISVVGTGHEMIGHEKEFIATVQVGPFVWHIFECYRE